MKPTYRTVLAIAFDLVAVVVAWVGGFLVRFNFEWPDNHVSQILVGLAVLLPVHVAAGHWVGLYRGIWAFASLLDLKRLLQTVSVSAATLVLVSATYRTPGSIPRSLLLLYPLLLILLTGGARVGWRMWKEHRLYGSAQLTGKPVVVIGAGRGGAMLVRELERSPDWRVVALVDDDPAKQGLELYGHPVAGTVADVAQVLQASEAQHAILAMPSATSETLRRAAELAVAAGAHVFTVPRLEDLMTGRVTISVMRPLAIEDLLGRDPVRIDTTHVQAMLAAKTVLVTGAGGSIGSELCRQLARFAPAKIVFFELSEFALYTLEQWFLANRMEVRIVSLAGDIRDAKRLEEVFAVHKPTIVFHAAAYKHVPLMEVGNAWQAVRNNVFGTLQVAECARRHGAERFVLISTDKAVNPTNVMGATKRLAELVCEALHREDPATQFTIVRFGNVLGSNGSVIPKFQEQIAKGGPVTVTHPDVTRYFMSIPEAAQLVLQAVAIGTGGEIFVLDMGKPVKILDMARSMIRLYGYTETQIPIELTGLRPGEKLYEELLADAETTRETPHPKLRIAQARSVEKNFVPRLRRWLDQSGPIGDDETRQQLAEWVPEYSPALQTHHGHSAAPR